MSIQEDSITSRSDIPEIKHGMSLKNINTTPRFTEHLVASGAFKEKPLLIVDVGARGGFEKHWSWYGDQARLIGFEQ